MRTNKSKRKEIFSSKEITIIQLICRGYQNKDIAKKLRRSIRTIEGHRDIIYQKAKVNNVARMVVYAIKKGIYKI